MKWLIAIPVVLMLALGGFMVMHNSGGGPSSGTGSHQNVATISTGEAVDLAPHLRAGTWTVVEFTADW